MIRSDLPAVLEIEQSFKFAWTAKDFLRRLDQSNSIAVVAERAEEVVGFTICALRNDNIHILKFAVNSNWRRRGVGSQIVQKLIGEVSSHRRTRLTLAVRETNLFAQLFFRELGFKAVCGLRGYHEDSGEDGYAMKFELGDDTGEHQEER